MFDQTSIAYLFIFGLVATVLVVILVWKRRDSGGEPTEEELLQGAGVQAKEAQSDDIFRAIWNQMFLILIIFFGPVITGFVMFAAYSFHSIDLLAAIGITIAGSAAFIGSGAGYWFHIITTTAPKRVVYVIHNPYTPTQMPTSRYLTLRENSPIELRIRDVLAAYKEKQRRVEILRHRIFQQPQAVPT